MCFSILEKKLRPKCLVPRFAQLVIEVQCYMQMLTSATFKSLNLSWTWMFFVESHEIEVAGKSVAEDDILRSVSQESDHFLPMSLD